MRCILKSANDAVMNWNIKDCRFVYEMDGRVIGYTMIAPTSSRDSYRGVVEVSIFVDEKYTKQGIGTVLLSKLTAEAETKMLKSMCIMEMVNIK